MFRRWSEVLTAAGVDPEEAPALLAPLALTSLKNAAIAQPARALTGPAARGDTEVINRHLAALSEVPGSAEAVYEVMLQATRVLLRPKKDQS